jgi:voltage-gated potassium channel
MQIKRKIILILVTIFIVILAGSSGYYIMFGGKPRFIDCVYMTVVSLTTVGYGEVIQITGNIPAQIYTMVLITFGMGIILYGISTLTAAIVEGELSGILRKNKMLKEIQKLKNHYIVCGAGETGRLVLEELIKNNETAVLIEQDEENIERCKAIGDILYVQGDATDDENLFGAGIENAAGIIISLPSDKDNLFVTMSARMHNRQIRIISRMIDQKLEPKLKKAGADSVVSPNFIGAMRMASEMIRPTVVYFLDKMLRSGRGDLRVHQITVSAHSRVVGKTLIESGLKDKYGLLVLAARYDREEIVFNPSPNHSLKVGTTLIVMGAVDKIAQAKKTLELLDLGQ